MASVRQTVSEHDVVVLRSRAGKWPAGSSGTVVSERGDDVLVEISDTSGVTLDLVAVAVSDVELRSAA
jgi:hypothetical protein